MDSSIIMEGAVRKLGHGRGKYYDRYLVLQEGGRLHYYHTKPNSNNPGADLEQPRRTYILNKNTVVSEVKEEKRGMYTFRVTWGEGDVVTTEQLSSSQQQPHSAPAAAAAASSDTGSAGGGFTLPWLLGGEDTAEPSTHGSGLVAPTKVPKLAALPGSQPAQRGKAGAAGGPHHSASDEARALVRQRRVRAAKIAATATGGVMIGVATVGVGLVAGAILATGAAAAGTGAAAYQHAKEKERHILALAFSDGQSLDEARRWRAALKRQVLDAATDRGGGPLLPTQTAHREATAHMRSGGGGGGGSGSSGSSPSQSLAHAAHAAAKAATSPAQARAKAKAGYAPDTHHHHEGGGGGGGGVPGLSSSPAASCVSVPHAVHPADPPGGLCGGWALDEAAWGDHDGDHDGDGDWGDDDWGEGFGLMGALAVDAFAAVSPLEPPLAAGAAGAAGGKHKANAAAAGGRALEPPLGARLPARRVRCPVRSSPLEAFIRLMSPNRIADAKGIVERVRLVESVDDHSDVLHLTCRPLYLETAHPAHAKGHHLSRRRRRRWRAWTGRLGRRRPVASGGAAAAASLWAGAVVGSGWLALRLAWGAAPSLGRVARALAPRFVVAMGERVRPLLSLAFRLVLGTALGAMHAAAAAAGLGTRPGLLFLGGSAALVAFLGLLCAMGARQLLRGGAAASARIDFCCLRRWRLDGRGAFVISFDSLEGGHSLCPVEKGTVRGSLHQVITLQAGQVAPFVARHNRAADWMLPGPAGGGWGRGEDGSGSAASFFGDAGRGSQCEGTEARGAKASEAWEDSRYDKGPLRSQLGGGGLGGGGSLAESSFSGAPLDGAGGGLSGGGLSGGGLSGGGLSGGGLSGDAAGADGAATRGLSPGGPDAFSARLAEIVAAAEAAGAEMSRVEGDQTLLTLAVQVDAREEAPATSAPQGAPAAPHLPAARPVARASKGRGWRRLLPGRLRGLGGRTGDADDEASGAAGVAAWSQSLGLARLLLLQAVDVRDGAEAARFLSVFFEAQRNHLILTGGE